MNKKAMLNLLDTWVDYAALFFLILGAIVSFFAGSKVLSILIVFVSSLIIGRLIYIKSHGHQLRLWYMIVAFVIGLIVGARFLSYKSVIVTFILGGYLGYYLKKHHYFG